MAHTHLGNIDATTDEIVTILQSSDEARSSQLTGPDTGGKSTTLRLIHQRLEKLDGEVPVVVSPPHQSLDAGQVGLLQIAGQLEDAGLLNGEFEEFIEAGETQTWFRQQSRVSRWLDRHSDSVVLLCDEPYQWPLRGDRERHFNEKTESLVRLLLDQTDCRRVIASKKGSEFDGRSFEVTGDRHYQDWLAGEVGDWNSLQESAYRLWDRFAERLHSLSPLKVRLLVALARLRSMDWIAQRFEEFESGNQSRLTNPLIQAISRQSTGDAFLDNWERCSLVREPLDEELVERFVDGELEGPVLEHPLRDILKHCILYPANGQFVLHEILQLTARRGETRWLSSVQKKETHEFLADYYANRFEELTGDDEAERALRCEFEGFHHALKTDRDEVEDDFRLFFVEQLNLFGKHLSHDLYEYEKATRVFERATDRDEENDYSHHYLAFNFDVRGVNPDRVEEHYRRAIELDDEHPWWWSRWICFLITRGRIREARDEWDRALDALGLPTFGSAPDNYYKNLHKWVARLLLEAGKLDFAERVLKGVPSHKKEELRGFRSMEELLTRLRDAERSEAVFPAYISVDERWEGPHLHPEKDDDDQSLVRWLPARVEGSDNKISLVVGEFSESQKEPEFARMEIPLDTFDQWSEGVHTSELKEGRFIELAIYGDPNSPPVIRAHHKSSHHPDNLPPLIPDPNRYLPKAGEG